MLGVNSYPKDYVDRCRRHVARQLETYEAVAAKMKDKAALAAFEQQLFNNMVLVLDELFLHRLRGKEGKDGNPLNEVRVMTAAVAANNGVMTSDSTIKLDPAKTVLGYHVGDELRISADDFARLAEAFFAEIELRYP